MSLLRTILMLSCLCIDGCSYAFVRPAPIDHEKRAQVDCTSSRTAPVADVVGALNFVTTVIVIEALSDMSLDGSGSRDVPTAGRVVEVGSVVLTGVEVASAAYGFRHTAECARAKSLAEQRSIMEPERTTPARPGCMSDADCKVGRSCVRGLCTWSK